MLAESIVWYLYFYFYFLDVTLPMTDIYQERKDSNSDENKYVLIIHGYYTQ